MKPRYHLEGKTETGDTVFSECGADRQLVLQPPAHGKPLQPGQSFVQIHKCDEMHYEVEQVSLSTGPVQVATKAYRDGWDRIFTKELN